jgi:cytochrome c
MSRHLVTLVVGAACILMVGCSGDSTPHVQAAHQAPSAPNMMIQYGCPSCHVIPDVPGAVGKVGPSLDALRQRSYLAGVLPNTPENLQRWVMHPQQIRPGTAMPEMGVSQANAQVIAAFLESGR